MISESANWCCRRLGARGEAEMVKRLEDIARRWVEPPQLG